MTMSVGEKRKRPEGKMAEEPPLIPCTIEELNHVLHKWIGDGIVRLLIVSRPSTEEKGRISCFAGFITMSSTLLRTVGPSVGFFTRSLGREPWSSLKRNQKCKGILYPTTRERE